MLGRLIFAIYPGRRAVTIGELGEEDSTATWLVSRTVTGGVASCRSTKGLEGYPDAVNGRAALWKPLRDGGRELEAETLLLSAWPGDVGVLFSIASRERDLRSALLARPEDEALFTLINTMLLPLLEGVLSPRCAWLCKGGLRRDSIELDGVGKLLALRLPVSSKL